MSALLDTLQCSMAIDGNGALLNSKTRQARP
jgi:hypothetical protein